MTRTSTKTIELVDDHKSYGPVIAVDSLSPLIDKGELFGLLEPNGAGKTTAVHEMGCDFNENKAGEFIRYAPRMNDSNEKEPGGWNTYEVVCKDDTIELKINGQLQNKATGVGLRKGYIGLQSEGAPIVFRNIKLTPLR